MSETGQQIDTDYQYELLFRRAGTAGPAITSGESRRWSLQSNRACHRTIPTLWSYFLLL
jgi:hypothetical protein